MVQIPTVINWSVTPQNGQVIYFELMNTWLFESTSVIASLNTAINKINEAGQEINNIAENAINAITFDNIAQLKLNSNIGRVDVLGYYTKGDGGGGTFYWDSTSTETDNGGTIIQATGIATGRWKRNILDRISVKQFGAKGDDTTDDSTSFNNATIYAISRGLSLVVNAAKYKLSSTWNIDLSENVYLSDRARISIVGDGKSNTVIRYVGVINTKAINIVGSNWATGGAFNRFKLSGIRFEGWSPLPSDNIVGLYIDKLIGGIFEDLEFIQFNYGGYFKDVVACSFSSVDFSYNNYGCSGVMGAGGFAGGSPFNEINFNKCHFISNRQYGAYFTQGGPINFYGGSFEGNGNTGAWISNSLRSSIIIENAGGNSGNGVLLSGVHFEGNAGQSDLYIAHNLYACSYLVEGCSFMRNGAVQTVTNSIYFNTTGASKASLMVTGTGFTEVNGFMPSASTAYIKYGTIVGSIHTFNELGNTYGTTAAAPRVAGVIGAKYGIEAMASCYANFNGSTTTINAKFNVQSIIRNSAGNYTITFEQPLKNTITVLAGSAVGNCVINKVSQSITNVRFETLLGNTGVAQDFNEISILVFNGGNNAG